MNTRRYFLTPVSLCHSSIVVSFPPISPATVLGDERMASTGGNNRNRSSRIHHSNSFLIRMAMKISRARWFSFLRRVFHYQNGGSRSDLGSNPFNSMTWIMMECIALSVQIIMSVYTLAVSKKEKPVWPMRIWVLGYVFACIVSVVVLYWRYLAFYVTTQRDDHSDMEQQRSHDESSFLGYNMNMGSVDRGASDEQLSSLPSWKYKEIGKKEELRNSGVENENTECCICLAKYGDKEEIRQLPCSHIFHLKCVDQWLRIISCCPLCKQELER
ncbi:uncharacterized protein LOC132636284 isoform X2 [Lycium barbarum]|uniref:uncharacterized protein LOC132636284 isoform X2 n=1 Tax=Lycium barbarum TaxID=112863 RepID=UPI00293F1613|nr:uncharacterized protein LOC132636284 isoform X2 [Lycium barbarum]